MIEKSLNDMHKVLGESNELISAPTTALRKCLTASQRLVSSFRSPSTLSFHILHGQVLSSHLTLMMLKVAFSFIEFKEIDIFLTFLSLVTALY